MKSWAGFDMTGLDCFLRCARVRRGNTLEDREKNVFQQVELLTFNLVTDNVFRSEGARKTQMQNANAAMHSPPRCFPELFLLVLSTEIYLKWQKVRVCQHNECLSHSKDLFSSVVAS